MPDYTQITKYIEILENDAPYGHDIEYREGNPFPFEYSEAVENFRSDFAYFAEAEYKEIDIHKYGDYVPEDEKAPEDYTRIEAMASIMMIIRGERFCDGAILDALRDGRIVSCLKVIQRSCAAEKRGKETKGIGPEIKKSGLLKKLFDHKKY